MIVETRKTAQGIEYWDTKEKRTLFVAKGKNPKFEVTEEYESMLQDEPGNEKQAAINLDEMDAEQLLAFAEQNDIKVPGNIKKEDSIRRYIAKENLEVSEHE